MPKDRALTLFCTHKNESIFINVQALHRCSPEKFEANSLEKRLCNGDYQPPGGHSNISVVHMHDHRFSIHTLNAISPLQGNTS